MDADAPPLPPEPSADAPAPPVKQEQDTTEQPTDTDTTITDAAVKQELGESIDYANADELLKARCWDTHAAPCQQNPTRNSMQRSAR